jgi:hypothetical protein
MALAGHLSAQLPDAATRKAIGREVADLKERLTWGMVFGRHTLVPVTPTSAGAPAAATISMPTSAGLLLHVLATIGRAG